MNGGIDINEYLPVFIDEAREYLQVLNDKLLILEEHPGDLDAIKEIFRAAHTLKGMSATMGFTSMAEVTHLMESALQPYRDKHDAVLPEDLIDLLFTALDYLQAQVDNLAAGGEVEPPEEDLLERLRKAASGEVGGGAKPAEAKVEKSAESKSPVQTAPQFDLNDYDRLVVEDAIRSGNVVAAVHVRLRENTMMKSVRAYMVVKVMEDMGGEIVKSVPPAEEIEQEKFDRDLYFLVILPPDTSLDELKKKIESIAEIEFAEVSKVESTAQAPEKTAEEKHPEEPKTQPKVTEVSRQPEPHKDAAKPQKADKKPAQKHHVEQLIRVPLSKLDKLMNLVGELVIYRTELQVAKERGSQDALEGVIERIGRAIIELQNEVMSMRMTPMAFVFNRFPRMVRDLAKRFGKKVKFIIEGAETEIDRSILDKLGDPLVHLLRNAIDHGIEPPEERVAAGKPEEGHLWLRAYAEGNYVFIEVEDDGRGIDPEKVKKKAIERGLLTPEEAENLTKREIYELLFRPGFSTAEKITDVSGRGVGLDVVKAVIEQLGGSIEVQSEVGKGTKFILRLPLTLAIITALLVTVGSEVYAIPLGSVDEVVEKDERLKKTQVGEVFLLRGDVLPVYYMSKIFNVPDAGEGSHLVVVRGAGARAALVIDDLIGQQEIVIKPLKGRYVSVPYISGATILGDGTIALIVDLTQFLMGGRE